MAKMKIKKGSMVRVIAGNSKGKSGLVKEVNRKNNTVCVEGVALCVKHYKARSQDDKSQKKVFEKFIHISNVALVVAS